MGWITWITYLLKKSIHKSSDDDQVNNMVNEYASGEPKVLQRDFYNSLKAAFSPDEVRAQLSEAGLEGFKVSIVSDRHLVVSS